MRITTHLKVFLISLAAAVLLSACSPYRVKKHPPKQGKVSILNFKRSDCGCH